jgi:hypothetical protein
MKGKQNMREKHFVRHYIIMPSTQAKTTVMHKS